MSFFNSNQDPWYTQPQQQPQQQQQNTQVQPGQFREYSSPNAWVPVQDYQKPMKQMHSTGPKNVYNTYEQAQVQKPKNPNPSPSPIKKKNDIEEEISTQNLYKTELCRSFQETGNCRYGTKCQFAHGAEELRPVLRHPKYKTEVCKTYLQFGHCPYGKRCRFIHSTSVAQNKPKSKQRPAYPDTSMLMAASPNLIAPQQETPENNFSNQTFNHYNQMPQQQPQMNFSNNDWSQLNVNTIQSQITKNQLLQLQLQQQQLQQLQMKLQQQEQLQKMQQQEQLQKMQQNNQFQYSNNNNNNAFDMNSMSNALPQFNQGFKTLPQTQSQSRLSFFQDLC